MYKISNNVAYIDGSQGKYDNKIKNPSVRYGMNACNNHKTYITDLPTEKMPPIQFEYRYMPDGKMNRYALLGNAYEELGQRTEVKTEELNAKLKETNDKINDSNKDSFIMPEITANALDLNKDGYVDIAEYSTSTLVQDALSSDEGFNINPEKIDGVINNNGENKSMALSLEKNKDIAGKIYQNLYNKFDLCTAKEDFKKAL